MFLSTRVIFFISILSGYGIFIHALPMITFTNSTSVSPREVTLSKVEFLDVDGEEYRMKFIMPMDKHPEVAGLYEMIDLYKKQRALVKKTKRANQSGDNQRLKKEALYASNAKLYLHHQADDTYDYLVIRDVRNGFPREGSPPLNFFHEWYLKDLNMNVENRLAQLRNLIDRQLTGWAADFSLTNPNVYFWSVLIDISFKSIVLIDWSPADDKEMGVEELHQGTTVELGDFYVEMGQFLPERFNVDTLKSVLGFFGKELRQTDGGPMDEIRLHGNNYDLELLPKANQGTRSITYDISGGFPLQDGHKVPAILKVIPKNENNSGADTKKEVEYLKKVGLHLFTKINSVASYIVMWDIRKLIVPLKPYHEWYLEDSNRNLNADLRKLQTNIGRRLMKYAKDNLLLYKDIHFLNIYVDKMLQLVTPVDWAPPVGRSWGVEEVTEMSDTVRLEYEQFLLKELPNMFNRKELAYILGRSGNKLRPGDREALAFNVQRSAALELTQTTIADGHAKRLKAFKTEGARHSPNPLS